MTLQRESVSAAEVIAAYLRAREASNETRWPVYVGTTPASKVKTITVYDTPGKIDGNSLHDGDVFQHNGIQIKVEATSHPVAYQKASSLFEDLSSVGGIPVEKDDLSFTLHSATPTSPVLTLGQGGPNRGSGFTFNLVVSIS